MRQRLGSATAIDRRAAGMRMAMAAMVASGIAPWLAGCGLFKDKPPPPPPPPKPPPPPPVLNISILAAPRLNPDSYGRNSPVVVRVYELKSPARFVSTAFMPLFEHDDAALAGDVVARDEFVLQPDGLNRIRRLLSAESAAIGVMAAFRDLDRAQWRAVVDLSPGRDNDITVELNDINVRANQARP